jgi:acetyltransferase-like isoleucine patch superfamily enzyme
MTSKPIGRFAFLHDFLRENGYFLVAQKIFSSVAHRLRDRALGRRLKTTHLRIGGAPKLAGLGHMQISENFSAGNGLWLEAVTSFAGVQYTPLLTIGTHVNFSDHVHVACTNRVSIGDGVLIGSRVIVSDHGHGIYAGEVQSSPQIRPTDRPLSNDKSVIIGRNVWIGDGVAVLGGADIGDGAIIGANSVVTGKIPAACIALGAPARPIRRWDIESAQWVRINPH